MIVPPARWWQARPFRSLGAADPRRRREQHRSARNGAFLDRLIAKDNMQEANMAMEDRETSSLIGSDKVEGTNVYGSDGQKIG